MTTVDWQNPDRVMTNGINLSYVDVGRGVPIVLLHGFPELGYSWRYQVEPLVAAGFRVIVPNQRGYDGSDAPLDPEAYSMKTLVADVIGLLDRLAIETAFFVGHDWGGMPAWHTGIYAPERVRGIIGLCTPYLGRPPVPSLQVWRNLRGPLNYMQTFQEPGVAEALLGRDIEGTFRALMRRRGLSMEEFDASPREVRELPAGVFVGDPQLFGDEMLTAAEIDVYVRAFTRSGFRGPLNWYRSMDRSWEESAGYDPVIDRPALMISARDDWFLPPSRCNGMEALVPQVEKHVVDGAHWIQQENPRDVNAVMLGWLARQAG